MPRLYDIPASIGLRLQGPSFGGDFEILEALHALFQGGLDGKTLHAGCTVEAGEARHTVEHVLGVLGAGNGSAMHEDHGVGRDGMHFGGDCRMIRETM